MKKNEKYIINTFKLRIHNFRKMKLEKFFIEEKTEYLEELINNLPLEFINKYKKIFNFSIFYNNIRIFKLLLDKINLEDSDFKKWRPIHFVCCNGNIEMLNLLLDKVNLEAKNILDQRPIHIACINNNYEAFKLLMNKVDLEAKDEIGMRLIHYSLYNYKEKIIKEILNKVDLEAETAMKWRPIHYASWIGNVKKVKLLLNKVNLEAEDKDKYRPIHLACIRSHFGIVKLLVDGFIDDRFYNSLPRIDINCKTIYGKTPIGLTENKVIKRYLLRKIDFLQSTLFNKVSKNFDDIDFIW